MQKTKIKAKPKKKRPEPYDPAHPWRLCPLGEFYRRAHSQSAYSRADGTLVSGSRHPPECVRNKSGIDQIYPEELEEISNRNFLNLSGPPVANDLDFEFGNDFDSLIRGWTKYWNEIFGGSDHLDADLVKALIATESSFKTKARPPENKSSRARGLMQLTSQTRQILSDEKGELKDHLVNVNDNELDDPNLNIAAGIRWLFRKKEIARSRMGKNASWRDAVAEYKDYDSDDPQMKKFDKFYKRLKDK